MKEGINVQYFWETVESVKAAKIKGIGFEHFDSTHMFWLILTLVACVAFSILYRCSDEKRRKIIRITIASIIVVSELVKDSILIAIGAFTVKYLPFHLCSINIFIIAIHSVTLSKTLGNFLYLLGIPGAVLAMVMPSWTELPFANFMHLFSFGIHVFLIAYPIMATIGGDIKPELRYVPKTLLLLLGFALVAFIVNQSPAGQEIRPNFMFLQSASDIKLLMLFKNRFGTHLTAFPILLAGIIVLFYAPPTLLQYVKKHNNKAN